jgi:type IV pilus assembly protein PilW
VINRKKRTLQQGLSIVELMVGIAMGLFITAGAIKLFVDNLGSNRQLLLETRLNQELRTAADIVARALRRASYWDEG